jgi:outer membrane usher protein
VLVAALYTCMPREMLAQEAPVTSVRPQTPPPLAAAPKPLPVEVIINDVANGSWLLLESQGVIYAPLEAFGEWRLVRRPAAQPIQHGGQSWVSLHSVAGLEARLDRAAQAMVINVPPAAFVPTSVSATQQGRRKPDPVEPALFLNIDTSLTLDHSRSSGTLRELGGLFEAAYASPIGVLSSTHLVANLIKLAPTQTRRTVRLETNLTRDFPEQNITVRLGDSATRTGLTGRSVYFGGLQIGRNFDLSPGFITQPIPVLSGTSSAPSTVELYINDALRHTSTVPAGPFALTDVPSLSGAGQVRMVVRDILGRETVLEQPFYSHAELLEKGLSDWSAEMGALRENLGTTNADYGLGFVSGTARYGLSPSLTGEARGEVSRRLVTLGLGATAALPFDALGTLAVTASRHRATGNGISWSAGVQRSGDMHSFGFRLTRGSLRFRQLGMDDVFPASRSEMSLNYAFSVAGGTLGLGYARVHSYQDGPISSLSLSYAMRIGELSSLSLSLVQARGAKRATSANATLTVPLESRMNSITSASSRGGRVDVNTSVSQGPSNDGGLSWRASAGTREGLLYSEAGGAYQADRAVLTADASVSSGRQALRLGAQGAVVLMDGGVYASRKIESGFALVEVPGHPNVGLALQGGKIARTDANGRALVSRLTPFQENRISLDPQDLPIGAEIDNIEQVATPLVRSGVKVVFPVRTGRAALVRLAMPDGTPVAAGAVVRIDGDERDFYTARRGEVFLTGLADKASLRADVNGEKCVFPIELPPVAADDILRIGPLTCKKVPS